MTRPNMPYPSEIPYLSCEAFKTFGGIHSPGPTVAVGDYVLHDWVFPHHHGIAVLPGASPWDAVQIRPLTALEKGAIKAGHVFPQVRVIGEYVWTDSESIRRTSVVLN